MSIDLESILNQTFNDEYNRIASRPLGNSESKNIDNVFININNITECLICCDDDKHCIKCFQCTATYCKVCLIKIASDFNKCSTCGVNIKENYKKIKEYNQELQEQLEIEKAIAISLNDYGNNYKNDSNNESCSDSDNDSENDSRNNKNINYNDDNDSEIDKKSIKNKNNKMQNKNKIKLKNNNLNKNLKPPSLMKIFKSKKNKNDKENEENNENENEKEKYYNYNIYDNKKNFIQDLVEDKIYNINFTSYINEISSNKPNYSYEWDYVNKTLTFYALCNNNKDFINIIVNYDILKSTFQSVLYIWLNEIAKCSFNIFKTKWNNIATKINDFSLKTGEISNQEIKKFTKDIVNICKN